MSEYQRQAVMVSGEPLEMLRAASVELDIPVSELGNRLIRECLTEVQKSKPGIPPTVLLLRRFRRLDLTIPDKLLINWLEKHFPDWASKTAEYRRLTVKLALETEDLDAVKLQAAADRAWKQIKAKSK